jgi:tetraacyldisaccharide 4'-kinase
MKIQHLIEQHWYYKNNPLLFVLLLPFTLIFFIVNLIRYALYKTNALKSYKLPVPVVIVGNISVGGAGKTPLTKHLAYELATLGISVGVILRGYKSKVKGTKIVHLTDSSILVGDEALIYASNNIRVAIGSNRYEAGMTLLKEYPDIKIILSDDGMQHYRLKRDYEIAVIDSSRMLGNRFTLPMGPLREPPSRLKSVNAVVFNGIANTNLPLPPLVVEQTLILDKIYNPKTKSIISVEELQSTNITAIAGIGNPNRFFDFLNKLDLKLNHTLAFPDHYLYKKEDIPINKEIILVTEKDYAKLSLFDRTDIWVVFVKASLNTSKLIEQISNLVQI